MPNKKSKSVDKSSVSRTRSSSVIKPVEIKNIKKPVDVLKNIQKGKLSMSKEPTLKLSTKKSLSKNISNDQKNNDNSLIGKTGIAKNTSKTNKSEQLSTQKTRNFFTVEEDWTILESIKKNKDYNISAISNQVGLKLGRSTESIRDRIKKYLSKIRANDQKKIELAARVNTIFQNWF